MFMLAFHFMSFSREVAPTFVSFLPWFGGSREPAWINMNPPDAFEISQIIRKKQNWKTKTHKTRRTKGLDLWTIWRFLVSQRMGMCSRLPSSIRWKQKQGRKIVYSKSFTETAHFQDRHVHIWCVNTCHSSPSLSHPILSYPILSYPILSYPIVFYLILSHPIWSHRIMFSCISCPILP